MQCSLTLLPSGAAGATQPAAIRIKATTATADARTPSHFICLIDVSGSMNDNNKLTYVKHCLTMLCKFLVPEDELTLITFGDRSEIVLKRMRITPATAGLAEQKIQQLRTTGSTNLSAGVASVLEIMNEVAGAAGAVAGPAPALKQGLLLLTDGHANRGVTEPTALLSMVSRLHTLHPALSISFLAYGTDHNTELMKSMSEAVLGPYSVVENLEGASLAIGECLGSIVSCVAQNVQIRVPAGTGIHGPYTLKEEGYTPEFGTIMIGDLYADTECLVLVDFPGAAATAVTVTGTLMPSLETVKIEIRDPVILEGRDKNIELTRLRYRCAELFRSIAEGASEALRSGIQAFEAAVRDPFYDDHPMIQLLREEVLSLNMALSAALQEARGGDRARGHGSQNIVSTMLLQHEAFHRLGRGVSMPIGAWPAAGPVGPSPVVGSPPLTPIFLHHNIASPIWLNYMQEESARDPVEPAAAPAPAATQGSASYLSPMASRHQRRIAEHLQRASMDPTEHSP